MILYFLKDLFGEARGCFQYSSILTRLEKIKHKLEMNIDSTSSPSEIDNYAKQVINAAELNSNISSVNDIDMDDIFNNDDDEEEEEEEDEEDND